MAEKYLFLAKPKGGRSALFGVSIIVGRCSLQQQIEIELARDNKLTGWRSFLSLKIGQLLWNQNSVASVAAMSVDYYRFKSLSVLIFGTLLSLERNALSSVSTKKAAELIKQDTQPRLWPLTNRISGVTRQSIVEAAFCIISFSSVGSSPVHPLNTHKQPQFWPTLLKEVSWKMLCSKPKPCPLPSSVAVALHSAFGVPTLSAHELLTFVPFLSEKFVTQKLHVIGTCLSWASSPHLKIFVCHLFLWCDEHFIDVCLQKSCTALLHNFCDAARVKFDSARYCDIRSRNLP